MPVSNLNELEWIPQQNIVLANIWLSTEIAAIDLESGRVLYRLDLSGLTPHGLEEPEQDVLNGIALAPDGKSLWVTGKRWPVIYVLPWPLYLL